MTKTRAIPVDKREPPCFRMIQPITEHDINAIKELAKGKASEHQQVLALRCIMNTISGAYDVPFVPGHTDQTNFREGRAFVGNRIDRIIRTDITTLLGAPHEKDVHTKTPVV